MAKAPDGARRLRLGLFGGTFDPPHVGHVAVARDVADALILDHVLWIPAGVPPHKDPRGMTPGFLRLEMARAAAAADPRFLVTDLELRRRGPSYTVDTLRAISARRPGDELFLMMGADQIRTFEHGWREPSEILRLATLVLMDRDGEAAPDVAPRLPGMERALHVSVTRVDLSSSDVRRRVAAGEDVGDSVPVGVRAVIQREGLYGGR
jgi:nicotinate-nucleotide adenylyltransferase